MRTFKTILLSIGLAGVLVSCDETSWLEEQPLDFYAPANSYETVAQYQQAVNALYNRYRNFAWNLGDDNRQTLWWGDLSFGGYDYSPAAKYNLYNGWVTPTTGRPGMIWNPMYQIIGDANQILYAADNIPNQLNDENKARIKGEALFFRGLAYTRLANLFGGVPITLEPVSEPKRDFVRASRAETYDQARLDLEEAARLLQNIDQVKDGMISKQACQHLLSEVYICLGRYADAIGAATSVINYPAMGLMTQRFGSRKDEPGDVYWDLFRVDNQNRSSSGNTESIWVLQYDYQSTGSTYSVAHPRQIIPGYWSATVQSAADPTKTVTAFTTWTAEKGGRGIGSMQGTDFFFNEVWGNDFDNDIRNSSVNIQRDWRIDNPAAAGYGQYIIADGWLRDADKIRIIFPAVQKFSRTGNFPEEAYTKNADGSLRTTALGEHYLTNGGSPNYSHSSFKDEYAFRLAETYLLRAEAYLGSNQKDLAAADINTIRSRANASPVAAADVDIDYILDERMRELYYEEIRLFTLTRLGKFVERAKKYNPRGEYVNTNMDLWPIPYSEIERNIYAELEQNPGY